MFNRPAQARIHIESVVHQEMPIVKQEGTTGQNDKAETRSLTEDMILGLFTIPMICYDLSCCDDAFTIKTI